MESTVNLEQIVANDIDDSIEFVNDSSVEFVNEDPTKV